MKWTPPQLRQKGPAKCRFPRAWLRAFALASVLSIFGQAMGTFAAAAPHHTCEQRCPDDGPDGTCPPFCSDCYCCSYPISVVSSSQPDPFLPTPSQAKVESSRETGLEAEPRDIFHVPKARLA